MLSTKVFTNVIKTYSGSVYFLTAEDNQRLSRVGNNDWFQVDDQKIKGSNISEILTTEEYYKQNPEAKPVSYPSFKSEQPISYTKKKRINNIKSMIKGFNNHFIGKEKSEASKVMLDKMELRLKEEEKSEDVSKPMNINKMFGYY